MERFTSRIYTLQPNIANTRVDIDDVEVGDLIRFVNVTNFDLFADDVVAFNPLQQIFQQLTLMKHFVTSITSTSSSGSQLGVLVQHLRIRHRVTVSWASANARNHFWNAGGQIRSMLV